jgi:hypothetical protein
VVLLIYGVSAFALGLLIGRAWVIAVVPAFWLVLWFGFVATGLPPGGNEGFNAIYVALAVSGTVAAALGVALRKLVSLLYAFRGSGGR